MKKIVFFLGAGASKPFGIPLTKEILPEILKSIEQNNLFEKINGGDYSENERKNMEQDLGDFLYALMPGLKDLYKEYKIDKDAINKFPLITDILSIIDYSSEYSNNLLGKPKTETRYFRQLLDRAIFEILADPENIKETAQLNKFVKHLQTLFFDGNEISIITTNYDATAEFLIYEQFKNPRNIDFGFSWREVEVQEIIRHQPEDSKVRIYKLHGSLNWLKCDLCDHLYINPRGNIVHHSFRTEIDDLNTCHCGNAPLKSLIVAPSLIREIKEPNLLHVWKSAVQVLRKADYWVIIGYSLPPEDLAIKSLLIRGKNASDLDLSEKNLFIVQKGDSTLNSYSLLFGKNNFRFIDGGLEEYLDKVDNSKVCFT